MGQLSRLTPEERLLRALMDEPTKPVTTTDRYNLGEQLEQQVRPLAGIRKRRSLEFVNDKSICMTCSNAAIYRRGSKNTHSIRCSRLGDVPNDIEECNSYQSITELSLDQMVQIATLLDQRDLLKGGYL